MARRKPITNPLHLPLPSQFPVLPTKAALDEKELMELLAKGEEGLHIAPAPYGDHGYVAALDRSGTCRACGKEGRIDRAPNRFPYCGHCGAIQFYMGKFYEAPCVTPNGRTDGHGSYVRFVPMVGWAPGDPEPGDYCAFCGRSVDEPLPEWPEIEAEDITIETGLDNRAPIPVGSWVRITHKYHPEISVFVHSEVSLLKNKAIALKQVREELKRIGRGAYNPEE